MPAAGVASYKGRMTTTTTTPSSTAVRRPLVLRPDALFDGQRAQLIDHPSVLIEGDTVVAVDTGRLDTFTDAEVIDLPGTTLVPGLIDIHVHLIFDGSPDAVGSLAMRTDEEALDTMVIAARRTLQAGITTVRDLGDRSYLATQVVDRAGAEPVPTIVAAGPPITTPGGHCHFLGEVACGANDLRASVREHVERGVGVIKVMASGGNVTPGSDPARAQYDEAEMRALVDEAHRHGLPVVAHAHSAEAIVHAVAAGVDGIEHCTFQTPAGIVPDQALIDEIARQRIVIGSTVGVLPGFTPPPSIAPHLAAIIASHRALHEAGAIVLAGTDAGLAPPKPHDVLPYGIEQLTDLGLTNVEALQANTSDAARALGLGDRKGRIAPGYDADLLVVRGNPLDDLARLRDVEAVWHAGRVVRDERATGRA